MHAGQESHEYWHCKENKIKRSFLILNDYLHNYYYYFIKNY